MRKLMDSVFAYYGLSAQVETPTGEQRVKVLFRSINSEAWRNTDQVFFPLGQIPRGRYICLLPAQLNLVPGMTLGVNGCSYRLQRVEKTMAFSEVVCQWALCVEKGREIDGA